ncbi:MAG: efflux RND transporter periplasmic adaptor subunit [Pseudomonadota bacterium]
MGCLNSVERLSRALLGRFRVVMLSSVLVILSVSGACTKPSDSKAGNAEDAASSKNAGAHESGNEGRAGKSDQATRNSHEGKGGGGRGSNGPVPVRVAEVEVKEAPRIVTTVTPLAGRVQAEVYSKVSGRISAIGPKEGQPVKQGEVLFRVDRSDPGESYLSAPVQSPISGWVGRWRVTNVGEQVTPSDPVVAIVDDHSLKAIAFVASADWLEISPETKVTAEVNGEERQGRIETIARSADVTSGRGSITVGIDNEGRTWRSGLYARLKFAVAPKPRLLIPAAALVVTDQGAYVYVVDGEEAKRTVVKFSMLDSDTVEITDGLGSKSMIVIAGGNLLGDRSPVRVVKD